MIAVVHIHKTAGTTLAGVFKRSYGTRHLDVLQFDRSTPHLTPDELRQTMDRCYPRLDSINAHPVRIYAGLEAVVPDIEYVTFLRDPIERTASHYQYDVQVGGVEIPFDEWITHEAVPDRQTRILAGPDASGEEAIALLARFAFVGRSDRFDEWLVMMQRKLSIPDIRYRSKWVAPSNQIKRELLSDPESVERLAAVNLEDQKVWDDAVAEVYPKQQAEFGSGLDDAVEEFRQRNSRMGRLQEYANPRYLGYVLKWRIRYRPWVRKITGDPTAG
ncbi:MAG: sulfotransferase family 2 domain-containing protein [Acidobacteria bacterium]|nr:sulfotransferase family 2 domain-containing protein [Acidobacteriota bacterium]